MGAVNAVALLTDGRAVTSGEDARIALWGPGEQTPLSVLQGHTAPVVALAVSRDGSKLASASWDHTARLWPEGNRAGPTLAGLFGRRIATLPGYNSSPALRALDIIWTPETVSKLFVLGPAPFTPGTEMPELRIGLPEECAALVKFLEKATKEK